MELPAVGLQVWLGSKGKLLGYIYPLHANLLLRPFLPSNALVRQAFSPSEKCYRKLLIGQPKNRKERRLEMAAAALNMAGCRVS